MGGLEKITDSILEKAKAEAALIIEKAEEEAESVKKAGEEEREKRKAEADERINEECERILRMGRGNDVREERQILLAAKSKAIKEIIEEAKDKMKNAERDRYLEILKKLLENSVSGKEGEIIFSERDKKLIDDGFIEECKQISSGKLTISNEVCNIDSGFIIRYGKIEINCSIDSIFEDKYNELTDLVNACINAD